MPTDNLHLHRKSIRLKDYDYSQPGAYFITLVTHARGCIFGEIQGETMALSRAGEIVKIVWELLPNYFPIRLDEWIIMPNHFHGIIVIEGFRPDGGARGPIDKSDGVGRGESGGDKRRSPPLTPFPPDSPLLRPNHGATSKGERPAGTVPGS